MKVTDSYSQQEEFGSVSECPLRNAGNLMQTLVPLHLLSLVFGVLRILSIFHAKDLSS
ncbi:MAG: hypothetical protein ACKO16_07155 [Gemmataceae bacterium]